jgi:hypothetical protein
LLDDLFVATVFAVIFLVLSWWWGRVTSGGKPLNQFKKRLLAFSFIFVLGMAYLMVLVSDLNWNRALLFPVIACWAVSVAGVAWYRYWKQKSGSSTP